VHTSLLIDAIVRQTTVLIAHLSTAAGIRAPLAHVADEVFLRLASEIEAQGVGQDALHAAVNAALPPAGDHKQYHLPFTAGMKKIRELTVREALRLGHNYIGTEHMLLGLLEAAEEPGAQILTRLGVTKAASEAWVLEKLGWLKQQSRNQ